MPPGGKDRRADGHRAAKPKSDKSKATEWSEWIQDGTQYYQFRNNKYGELEKRMHPGTAVNDHPQVERYNKTEKPRFGNPPNGPKCECGAGCSPGGGCVPSTTFGDPKEVKRKGRIEVKIT